MFHPTKLMKSVNFCNISVLKNLSLIHKSMTFILLFFIFGNLSSYSLAQELISEVDTAAFLREAMELHELLVTPGKEKYSKRNPAVELVETIRKNQKKGDPTQQDTYSYDQYDKLTLGLLDIDQEDMNRYESLKTYLDTTADGKRQMLKVLLNERASTILYNRNGKDRKTIMRGKTSKGVSEMFDDDNVEVIFDNFLKEIDIYENDITLLSNKFPSPLSSAGNIHYKYFIADTLDIDGVRCIQITFIPRNPAGFSFSGNLYAELGDTTGFIKKVAMKIPRTVNLNFIDNVNIEQLYEKDSKGYRHKMSDRLNLDICIVEGSQRFYADRISRYENFSDRIRTDLAKAYNSLEPYIEIGDPDDKKEFLRGMRGDGLSDAETNMDTFMAHLREYPLFYWSEKILVVLVNGYIKTGKNSKFDFGPINTFISTNPIEKIRLRLGGMTTANLSPHWFVKGYLAYGTHDRKWKYKGELEYSFNKKKYHSREYPINSISFMHMYDMDMIGQHYEFTNADNIFLSLKRKTDKLITYRHLTRCEYKIELPRNFLFSLWGEHVKQDASPWLPFINGYGDQARNYRHISIGTSFRYAPGEKFVQGNDGRLEVNNEVPIFLISQEWGPKGLRGYVYSVCKTELSARKRFWFSSFGYLDAIIKGGIIWSQVPFPELLWQNANLSYTIQPESYSLMNPMEFAMDKYASCDVTYWGNGVLFNRIPIVKLAKFREVVGFKCLWGSLSDKNNPMLHKNLFRFPGDAVTSVMGKTPYMEISAGIDNIFKILRVDYVWRLTYLKTPGIDKSGIRVALHFNF